jgi:hypothetical protein
MMLNPETLKKIIVILTNTHAGEGELSCDECYEEIDHFAEIELVGKSAAEAMPLVQEHLEHCQDCREEYEALVAALKYMEQDKPEA